MIRPKPKDPNSLKDQTVKKQKDHILRFQKDIKIFTERK